MFSRHIYSMSVRNLVRPDWIKRLKVPILLSPHSSFIILQLPECARGHMRAPVYVKGQVMQYVRYNEWRLFLIRS